MKQRIFGSALGILLLSSASVWAKSPASSIPKAPASRPAAAHTVPEKPKPVPASNKQHKKLAERLAVMKSELKRYWKVMQAKKAPKAFYMSYALEQNQQVTIQAKDGLISTTADGRKSPKTYLRVKIRVGNHQLDNTGRDGYDWKIYRHLLPGPRSLPYRADNEMLRKILWKLTDRRYKEALGQYNRKRYVRSLKAEIKDKSGDFSKEPVIRSVRYPGPLKLDMKRWKGILRRVTAFSLKDKRVVNSSVTVSASRYVFAMIDSNGTELVKSKTIYRYLVYLTYLSPEREYLSNTFLEYCDTEKRLPSEAKLIEIVKRTYDELKSLGSAPKAEPVEAPAILLPGVSGVLFHEALGHRLEGQRMVKESDGKTFLRKIGKKVIPSFISVYDDPTLPQWKGTPLNGFYGYDEQGVKAQRVTLIENGVLRGFLMSRKPVGKFKHSNGHGRSSPGRAPFSRQGNLLVSSSRSFSDKKIREMLIAEAKKQGKPHAFVIGRSSGGYTHTSTFNIQSFKNRPKLVFQIDVKTGKQKLVKGLEIIGTPLTVVNNIVATGTTTGVFNGFCGAESGWVPVSAIAPTLLLKTIELQRVKINKKKDYLLPSPFAPAKAVKTKSTKAAKKEIDQTLEKMEKIVKSSKKTLKEWNKKLTNRETRTKALKSGIKALIAARRAKKSKTEQRKAYKDALDAVMGVKKAKVRVQEEKAAAMKVASQKEQAAQAAAAKAKAAAEALKAAQQAKAAAEAFAKAQAAEQRSAKTARVVRTKSGLGYVLVRAGTGASPKKGQLVTVHYTGWLIRGYDAKGMPIKGKKFDSSRDRRRKFRFPIGMRRVIPGWDEGVAMMRIGGRRLLVLPAKLGYGARGAGHVIPPNADLLFDVELYSAQ